MKMPVETKCVKNSGKKQPKDIVPLDITKCTAGKTTRSQATSKYSSKNCSIAPPSHPKSHLKTSVPPVSNTKHNVDVASFKPVSSTNIIKKPAEKVLNTSKPLPKTTSGKAKAAPADSVKPITAKSRSVNKKPTKTIAAKKCKVTVKPKTMVMHVPPRLSGQRCTLANSESSLCFSPRSDMFNDVQLPQPLVNIDQEYLNDPEYVYAYEIFEYLKTRESHFQIKDNMSAQPGYNEYSRMCLINWMVGIQEYFRLGSETLYLAVKLVDTYVSKVEVSKANVRLVGATAMLIAAKYNSKYYPSIKELLTKCKISCKEDMTTMEVNILREIHFELSFPLSCNFLAWYVRCGKVSISCLDWACFILDFSLLEYFTVTLSDSKLAAAALYLAFRMDEEQKQEWDATLVHVSVYFNFFHL